MNLRTLTAVALVAGTAVVAPAQSVFNGALVELYYTQMMDNNLRLNSAAHSPAYQQLVAGMTENQFLVKRAELYFGGKVNDDVSWSMMIDPNNTSGTNTTFGAVLHDVWAIWKFAPGFTMRAGQGKFLQSYEASTTSARDIMFYDRAQLSRFIGDRRDRGIWIAYDFGDPKGFNGKVNVAVTNGMSDNGTGGKQPEVNAQKDFHFRLDFATGQHKFGTYYRDGSLAIKDVGTVSGTPWTGGPSAADILANKDRATNMGFYYFTDTAKYQVTGEVATGLLGRRYASIFASGTNAMAREHLDQKYLGYFVQGAYKMGKHWFTARYDFMNYNSGDQWYGPYNPYKQNTTTGASTGNDYSPKFTEVNVGYNYIFNPSKSSSGKLKLNYVMRSKNFLAPRTGQTGEQGGVSLVASWQVAF